MKSVLGGTGPRVNSRVEFYNKFQREMDEHDRDFEKKYDEDLNTTLIFVCWFTCRVGFGKLLWTLCLPWDFVQSGLFSAVTSAFIIDVQSELKPDYEEMNNTHHSRCSSMPPPETSPPIPPPPYLDGPVPTLLLFRFNAFSMRRYPPLS